MRRQYRQKCRAPQALLFCFGNTQNTSESILKVLATRSNHVFLKLRKVAPLHSSAFKFFAKCLDCRLYEAGQPVPPDVIKVLGKDHFKTKLKVTFQINEDQLLPDADRTKRSGSHQCNRS